MSDEYKCSSCGATDLVEDLQEFEVGGGYICNNCFNPMKLLTPIRAILDEARAFYSSPPTVAECAKRLEEWAEWAEKVGMPNFEKENEMTCKKCAGEMKKGKALLNTFPSLEGVPKGVRKTITRDGEAEMVSVYKCTKCGYSHT